MFFPEEKNVEANWFTSLSLGFRIYKMGLLPALPALCEQTGHKQRTHSSEPGCWEAMWVECWDAELQTWFWDARSRGSMLGFASSLMMQLGSRKGFLAVLRVTGRGGREAPCRMELTGEAVVGASGRGGQAGRGDEDPP